MPKFVTIQNLEQYNSKINPRIQDLEQVSDLGYLVNYIKQTQPVTYTVELDGKTYTYKASAEQSESLPKLSDIEDYYGFSQIKEYVETIKNANYLPLTGGNVTGNLTVQDKNVVRSVNGVNADVNGNVQIGFPSDTFINVTSFPFTAPSDGWITVRAVATASIPGAYVLLETKSSGGETKLISISARYYDTQTSTGDNLPVKKGDIVNIAFNNMRLVTAKFFYAEGEI